MKYILLFSVVSLLTAGGEKFIIEKFIIKNYHICTLL